MYCDRDNPTGALVCDIKVTEALDSRSSTTNKTGDAWELHFFMQGTNDECAIRARLEPGKVYGLPKTFPTINPGEAGQGDTLRSYPLQEFQVTNIGWQLWEVTARYAWDGAIDRNVFSVSLPTQISMSTRGGNIKLSQSIKTLQSYPQLTNPGGAAEMPAPNFEGAIEWDGKTVKGVQVPAPLTRYSEVWIFPASRIFSPVYTSEQPQNYSLVSASKRKSKNITWANRISVWADYTGTVHGPVNQKPRTDISEGDKPQEEQDQDQWYKDEPSLQKARFRGWKPGEVQLDNVNLRQVGLHHYEVSFDFLIQTNREDGIALPWTVEDYMSDSRPIDGWDYIWTYNEIKSATANNEKPTNEQYQLNAPVPEFIYVERVFERRNFTQLDIGNAGFSPAMNNQACSIDLMNWWDRACRRDNPRGQ